MGPPADKPETKGSGMVIPSLTKGSFDIDEEDEAEALDRLSPEASMPGVGIPDDDGDDLMSQLAAGSHVPERSPEELDDRYHHDVVPSSSGVVHHLFWRR